MTASPAARLLWKNLVTILATGTTKPVDLARVPSGVTFDADQTLVDPYAIVYPLIATQLSGSLGGPDEQVCVPWQVTSVGANGEQAQAMADRVRESLLARNPNGSLVNVLVDVHEIDRRPTMFGGPESAEGGLWQVVDSFESELTV